MTEPSDLHISATILAPRLLDGNDLRLHVVLTNIGATNLQLCTLPFPYAAVVLQIETDRGVFVGGGPPPIPPPYEGLKSCVILAPGETYARMYTGAEYLVHRVPPGRYRIKFRYKHLYADTGDWTGEVNSAWLPFEVVRPDAR